MNPLEQWYVLRLEESVLKANIARIAPAATEAALEQVAGEEKNTFPIGSAGHKIQIRLTAKKIKPDDDLELSNLHAEIQVEKEAAAQDNADAIAQIEKDLVSLKLSLERLKNTDRGRALETQYNERLDQLAELVPVLALKGV